MRLDQFLVQHKKIESRTKAQDLIAQGLVQFKNKVLTKSSFDVTEDMFSEITITENNLSQFVSRAGFKLSGALDYVKQQVAGLTVLDVGQSTGGFTDALLQRQAKHVTGLDVGSVQLHEKIKSDTRVTYFENLNVKDIASHSLANERFDGVVCDVSFISLTKVVTFLEPLLKPQGFFLFLVKPQFECGPQALDKNGIVSDAKVYDAIQVNITSLCEQLFQCECKYFESSITGKDGNKEFFIYGRKK
ncbi:TlyA family rRNA (cytidine-2'-O)-methyltransferase [Bdellovibrio sp. qaytius]|nr:TlyA family rRNA (cytidine-2'-O)-methyltransferase [Bdellovibrio sp. qaytius]